MFSSVIEGLNKILSKGHLCPGNGLDFSFCRQFLQVVDHKLIKCSNRINGSDGRE